MAGSKYIRTARKLQTACKQLFGVRLLIDQKQWYHKDKDTAITVYTLYQVTDTEKKSKQQLFQTYSQVQLVLFMRDLWYQLNDWEIPRDNEVWEEIKRKYAERKEPSQKEPCAERSEGDASECVEPNRTAVCDELYKGWKRNRRSKDDT